MNDIFYFLDIDIDSKDICNVLEKESNIEILISNNRNDFVTNYNNINEMIHIEWYKINLYDLDYNELKYLESVRTIYCICHKKYYIDFIIKELKKLLNIFGGTIGNDNRYFEPLYNKYNIDNFNYK